MARIRSIHPDALKSAKLAQLTGDVERLYWRLLTHCDDEGRCEDEPLLLAAFLFPLNESIVGAVVNVWLTELHDVGLILRYKAGDTRILQVRKWEDYQRPQKTTPSRLPPPTGEVSDDSDTSPVAVSEDSHTTTTPLQEDSHTGSVEVWPVVVDGEGDVDGDVKDSSSETPEPTTDLVLVTASPAATTDPIRSVFEAWQEATGHNRARLDPKRRKLIAAALKSYPAGDVRDAVTGWRHSPFHRGENDQRTLYNGLELLLRDAAHIEQFRDLERGEACVRAGPSVPDAWAAIAVLDGRR